MTARIATLVLALAACKGNGDPAQEATPAPTPVSKQPPAPPTPPPPAPTGPPTDADFTAIHPAADPTLTLCSIQITVTPGLPPGTRVELAYARDNHLARREHWEYDRGGANAHKVESDVYTWKDGRLAELRDEVRGRHVTYAYDANGLLASADLGAVTVALVWHVKPITDFHRTAMPSHVDELDQLPWELPFTGSVNYIIKGPHAPDTTTYRYDRWGHLLGGGISRDAQSRVTAQGTTKWIWKGDQVAQQQVGDATSTIDYTYDADGRRTRSQTRDHGALVGEVRNEYRCPGWWIDDPLWP